MRFFKNRPLLAVAIVLALVGVASGGAYVIKHSLLTIDPTKSAPEIEHDVETQLQQNGVNAAVNAEKSDDGQLQLTISSTDDDLPKKLQEMGAIVVTQGGSAQDEQRRITIEDHAKLDPAQELRLTKAITSHDVIKALAQDPDHARDIVEDALGEAGFTDVEVVEAGSNIVVTVKSPPSP